VGQGHVQDSARIRVDPAGNVWDGGRQYIHVVKYTPEGKKLLEISAARSLTRPGHLRRTDVAFAQNGNVFVSAVTANVASSSTPRTERSCANSASAAPGPAN